MFLSSVIPLIHGSKVVRPLDLIVPSISLSQRRIRKVMSNRIRISYSIGIPLFIKGALVRREVAMIGKGLAKWTNVHIDDLVELFIILFKTILSNPEKIGHGREGYFFAGNGERTWFDLP
ncbi:unnamed protein product [Somion occarium]|uniref:Uncharacterized protein n=1 Tax=Somion occarium TaxID=3059160 RepID=A0ABP1D6X7_9APHY